MIKLAERLNIEIPPCALRLTEYSEMAEYNLPKLSDQHGTNMVQVDMWDMKSDELEF